jgi:HAD superfamily hydrolase (TIGR01450 family)
MKKISADEIIAHYDLILLDAFGVLVDKSGAIAGATPFIDRLNQLGKDYLILTNGSKFLPEESALGYQKKGLNIPAAKVISSGSLLRDWVLAQNLIGKNAWVLGPSSCLKVVEVSGLVPVSFEKDADCFVLGNQDGFRFPEDIDILISRVLHLFNHNKTIPLICPNPDMIYPLGNHQYGITSGAIAVLVEKSLEALTGTDYFKFHFLGKPFSPIFEKATSSFLGKKICMIGDQLSTDILGALNFGITAILVETGIANSAANFSKVKPDYLLENLLLKSSK